MSRKETFASIFYVSASLFLFFLWWGSWFLRQGLDGPHGWAILPVVITSLIFLAIAFGAVVSAES